MRVEPSRRRAQRAEAGDPQTGVESHGKGLGSAPRKRRSCRRF